MRALFITRRKHAQALDESWAERCQAVNAGAARLNRRVDQHSAHIQSLIDEIAHQYYLASAIHAASPIGNAHQIGVMDGLGRAMAAVTGRDIISTGFQMDHGIPQGPDGQDWLAVVDVIDGRDVPVLLHDDVREPVSERLDALRIAALRKDSHPLATILANA